MRLEVHYPIQRRVLTGAVRGPIRAALNALVHSRRDGALHDSFLPLMVLLACVPLAMVMPACSNRKEANKGGAARDEIQPLMLEAEPLHNVIEIVPGVYSGSGAATSADFAALASLGVRSIVSVDGATPAIELARANGMRYAHVPIAYAGVEAHERVALARALRDLPRPIYVHCHHGVHRGPAAAAVGLVCTGEISSERGLELLGMAGTSASYSGLFDAVASARAMDDGEIDAIELAGEVADVGDFVRAMADIDRAFDHLKLLKQHGWSAPADHPDLVASAEAGLIHDRLRGIRLANAHEWREDGRFLALLGASESAAEVFERLLAEGSDGSASAFERLSASCKDCHAEYR